jgi:hypothetical protein
VDLVAPVPSFTGRTCGTRNERLILARHRAKSLGSGQCIATLDVMAYRSGVHERTVDHDPAGAGQGSRGHHGVVLRPTDQYPHRDLVDHLVRTTQLPAEIVERVVDDVVAYFAEPVEAVVRRRHRELQARGLANPAIFERIVAELAERPVAAPSLSPRQIRRIVYG